MGKDYSWHWKAASPWLLYGELFNFEGRSPHTLTEADFLWGQSFFCKQFPIICQLRCSSSFKKLHSSADCKFSVQEFGHLVLCDRIPRWTHRLPGFYYSEKTFLNRTLPFLQITARAGGVFAQLPAMPGEQHQRGALLSACGSQALLGSDWGQRG